MDGNAVAAIERAMVALRRSQTRRTLHRRVAGDAATPAEAATVQVLDAIEAAGDRGEVLTVNGVADALGVDQPRASRLVARAVDAGLVRRGADPDDGRRSLLTLTSSGRGMLAHVQRVRRAAVQSAVAGWSPEDRTTFARLLVAYVRSWEQQGARAQPSGPGGEVAARDGA
jgi:DNA-binding MarR family transcriptional regulator